MVVRAKNSINAGLPARAGARHDAALRWGLVLACTFLGAAHRALTPAAIICAALCGASLSAEYVKRPSYETCAGILLLLCMQNFCIGLGAHLFGNTDESLRYLTQIPFIVVFCVWAGGAASRKMEKLSPQSFCFVLLLAAMAVSLTLGRGTLTATLVNVRNLTVFFMGFSIARYNLKESGQFKKFAAFFMGLSAAMFAAGAVLLIAGYPLYEAIGIHEVYIAKAAPFEEGRLDYRFFTTLLYTQYTRMGSLYYEPVNLAYFFAAALLVSLLYRWTNNGRVRFAACLVNGAGLFLTFGKGGYLMAGTALMCVAGERVLKALCAALGIRTNQRTPYVAATAVLGGVLFVLFCIYYVRNIGAAVLPHFEGIVKTWQSVLKRPFGYGLGTGGNAAIALGGEGLFSDVLAAGGETGLLSYMYQLGIWGCAIFSVCVFSLSAGGEGRAYYMLFAYLPLILLAVSVLQDNTFSPQCILPFMFLQGAARAVKSEK